MMMMVCRRRRMGCRTRGWPISWSPSEHTHLDQINLLASGLDNPLLRSMNVEKEKRREKVNPTY